MSQRTTMNTTTPPRGRCVENRSQSLAEFAMVLPIFLTLMCGLFDYGWMIGNSNVMALATREAGNTASRQNTDPVGRGLEAAVNSARPRLDLTSSSGGVIITRVTYDTNTNSTFVYVSAPIAGNCMSTGGLYGGGNTLLNKSRILISGETWDSNNLRRLPFSASNLAQEQQMYCVEVLYTNEFVTPIGTLIGLVTPPRLYDAAFF